jgi:hypothetical protein
MQPWCVSPLFLPTLPACFLELNGCFVRELGCVGPWHAGGSPKVVPSVRPWDGWVRGSWPRTLRGTLLHWPAVSVDTTQRGRAQHRERAPIHGSGEVNQVGELDVPGVRALPLTHFPRNTCAALAQCTRLKSLSRAARTTSSPSSLEHRRESQRCTRTHPWRGITSQLSLERMPRRERLVQVSGHLT